MREGWKEVCLGDAITLHYGKPMRDVDRVAGEVPVVGSAGVFGWHNEPNVRTRSSIIVGRKGTAGSVTWFDGRVWATDTSYWVEPKIESSLEFIHLLLQNADLPGMTAQTGVPGLNRDRAYSAQVLLPPIEEQQRIVDLIGSLDEAIEAADAAAGATLTATDELRRDLFAPRDGVETVTLKDVARWGSGKYVAKENRAIDGLYPIFGANGEIGRTDSFLYDEDLITVGRVGACGEVHRVSGKSWVSDNALVARPELENFNYVYQAVQSVDYGALISGTSQPLITQTALLGVKVSWPPKDEREWIASVLADSTSATAAAQAYAGALRVCRADLLTVLLSGEHKVPASYDLTTGAAA